MAVFYEWGVETVTAVDNEDHEENEVLDHDFCGSFAQAKAIADCAPPEGCRFDIVLVRDDDDRRSWAYLDDGKLPLYAEDANGSQWGEIPKKFHQEVAVKVEI